MLTSDQIRKYSKVTTKRLKARAIQAFNAWIRKRDEGQLCISCSQFKELQAGHFYSAGKFQHIRFNEDNVHGQCLQDNFYEQQSDTLYRENLIKKIGIERVERLDLLAAQKSGYKDDRFHFIEIILTYKSI